MTSSRRVDEDTPPWTWVAVKATGERGFFYGIGADGKAAVRFGDATSDIDYGVDPDTLSEADQ